MKIKFILFLFIILACLSFISAVSTTTYYPNGSGQIAYYGKDSNNPPSPVLSGWDLDATAESSANEDAISLSDNTRNAVSIVDGTNQYNIQMVMFDITQNPATIYNITYVWEGYNDALFELASANDLYFYIYNFTSSSWGTSRNSSCLNDACGTSGTEKSLNYILTSGFSDYINSSGHALFLVNELDTNLACPVVYSWTGEEYLMDSMVIPNINSSEKETLTLSNLTNLKIENGKATLQLRELLNETSQLDEIFLSIKRKFLFFNFDKKIYPHKAILNGKEISLKEISKSDNVYLTTTFNDTLELYFEDVPDKKLSLGVEGYFTLHGKRPDHNTLYTDLMKIDVTYEDDPDLDPDGTLSPASGTSFSIDDVSLMCNFTDDWGLKNFSFYTNTTGTWHLNRTVFPEATNFMVDDYINNGMNMTGNVLLYHFNNDSSYDNSSHYYDFSGNNTWGQKVSFDGDENIEGYYGNSINISTNDYVTTNSKMMGTTSGTIMAWVNFRGHVSTNDYSIIANYNGGAFSSGEFLLYINNDQELEFLSATGSAQANYTVYGGAGAWHHVALTWAPNNVVLYIDSVSRATDTAFSDTILGFSSANIVIGRDNDNAASPNANRDFDGKLDEIIVFNRSLNSTEVRNFYNGTMLRYYTNLSLTNLPDSLNYIWNCYGTDNASQSAWAETSNFSFAIRVPPSFTASSNSTNSTTAGKQIQHITSWTDNTALSGYIFSFANGTSTFVNDSFVSMNGVSNWSNVTKGVNTTIGSTIQWKVFANDSTNNWGVSDTFSYPTIFFGWNVSSAINNSLEENGANSQSGAFQMDGLFHLMTGNALGTFNAFTWNYSHWDVNTTLINGLPDIGSSSSPDVFKMDNLFHLISGEGAGGFNGFTWNGSHWNQNLTINSSLSTSGLSTPDIFEISGLHHLITGEVGGDFIGFTWNGSTWVSNTSIVNSLTGLGDSSDLSVFQKEGLYHLITGRYTGALQGHTWNGTHWNSNISTSNSLYDVGTLSSPNVFNTSNNLYLLVGSQTGTFTGFVWNMSNAESTLTAPTISMIYPSTNDSVNYNFIKALCNVTSNTTELLNISLYSNSSGSFASVYNEEPNVIMNETTYRLYQTGLSNGTKAFYCRACNSEGCVNSNQKQITVGWNSAGITNLSGYWLFRIGDRNEDGTEFCRTHNISAGATQGGVGNGWDTGCIWRDGYYGNGSVWTGNLEEENYCSIWTQFYFDQEGNYTTGQNMSRLYCHIWQYSSSNLTTNHLYGWSPSGYYSTLNTNGYTEGSASTSYYDYRNSSISPPVGNAGYYWLYIYDNSTFDRMVLGEEIYNMSYYHEPSTSHPQTLLYSNQKSFCLVYTSTTTNETLNTTDSDSDGLMDWQEMFQTYTDPYDSNTDDDFYNDFVENNLGGIGYDPYDDDYTSIIKMGEENATGVYGWINYSQSLVLPFSANNSLNYTYSGAEQTNFDSLLDGSVTTKTLANSSHPYALVQTNFVFNITNDVDDINSVVIAVQNFFGYAGANPDGSPSPSPFWNSSVDIYKNNDGSHERFIGSNLGYRQLSIKRVLSDFPDYLFNVNKSIYVRAVSAYNTTGATNVTIDTGFTQVKITKKPYPEIVVPTVTSPITVQYPQNISISMNYVNTYLNLTNATINGVLCPLTTNAVYQGGNVWKQNCSIPNLIGGTYDLKVFVNTSETQTTTDTELQSITFQGNYERSIGSSITSIDYLQRKGGFIKAVVSDTLLSDMLKTILGAFRKIPDSLNLADNINKLLFGNRNINSITILNDFSSRILGGKIAIDSNVVIGDNMLVKYSAVVQSMQSFILNDIVLKQISLYRIQDSPLTLYDMITNNFLTLRNFDSSLSFIDNIERILSSKRTVDSNSLLTDNFNNNIAANRNSDSQVTFSDIVLSPLALIKNLQSDVILSDITMSIFGANRIGDSQIYLTDYELTRLLVNRNPGDSLTLSDNSKYNIFGIRNLFESLLLTDALQSNRINLISVNSNTGLLDYILRMLGANRISDSQVVLSDAEINKLIIDRKLEDNINLDNNVNRILYGIRSLFDNFALYDNIQYIFADIGLSNSVNVDSSFSIADFIARLFGANRITDSNVIITDNEQNNLSANRNSDSNINLNGNVLRNLFGFRNSDSSFNIIDFITRIFGGNRNIDSNTVLSDAEKTNAALITNTQSSTTVSDNSVRILYTSRAFFDNLFLSDNVQYEFIDVGLTNIRNADSSFNFADIISRIFGGNKAVDSNTILSDFEKNQMLLNSNALQGITLTDGATRILIVTKSSSDSIVVGDSILNQIIGVRSINSQISLNSAVDRLFLGIITVNSNSILSDSVILKLLAIRLSDSSFILVDNTESTYLDIGSLYERLITSNLNLFDNETSSFSFIRSLSQSLALDMTVQRIAYLTQSINSFIEFFISLITSSSSGTTTPVTGGAGIPQSMFGGVKDVIFNIADNIILIIVLMSIFLFILIFSFYTYQKTTRRNQSNKSLQKLILTFVALAVIISIGMLIYYLYHHL